MTVEATGPVVDVTGPFPNNTIGVAQITGVWAHGLADGNILHVWANPATATNPVTAFFAVTDTAGNFVMDPQRLTTDALLPPAGFGGYQETVYGATVDASGNLTIYFHVFFGGDPFDGDPPPVDGNYVRSFGPTGTPLDPEPVETSFGGLTFLVGSVGWQAGVMQLSNGNLALADGRGLVIMDDSGTVLAGPNGVVLPGNS